jgi:predicted porin
MKGRTRVFDSSSRLGFRVNESLGGGMRAFVVIESGVNIDTGNILGQANTSGTNGSSGFWASRSSYLGLGGGWGDIRFGRQDVWYGNGIVQQAGSNYINTAVDSVWTHFGQGITAPGGRTSNTLSYNSPTMGGFNASLSWSPAAGAEGATFTGGTQEPEARWGVTARYSGGPLRGQVDWAQDKNVGNVDGDKNKGFKVGVGFAYAPDSQVSVVSGQVESVRAGADNDPKLRVTVLNWEHMLGQWQLIAQYMFTGKLKGTADDTDTKSKGYTLAAKYFLSKRTGVYASFNQYRNEDRANMDFGTGGCLSSAAACHLSIAQSGADPRIVALGVMHNF